MACKAVEIFLDLFRADKPSPRHEQMALFGCRAVPQHCAEVINAVPAVTAFAAKLAAASINGGSRINHQALADIMPSLRDVDAIVSSLRAMASDLGIAA